MGYQVDFEPIYWDEKAMFRNRPRNYSRSFATKDGARRRLHTVIRGCWPCIKRGYRIINLPMAGVFFRRRVYRVAEGTRRRGGFYQFYPF